MRQRLTELCSLLGFLKAGRLADAKKVLTFFPQLGKHIEASTDLEAGARSYLNQEIVLLTKARLDQVACSSDMPADKARKAQRLQHWLGAWSGVQNS